MFFGGTEEYLTFILRLYKGDITFILSYANC